MVASSEPATRMLLLGALNQMFDISATRTLVGSIHPPNTIFVMLGALVLVCSLFAGHATAGSRTHSWIHVLGLACTLAVTVVVIIDIEYPRRGLIRVDAFDQALVELAGSMR